jgi:hypothetical protein
VHRPEPVRVRPGAELTWTSAYPRRVKLLELGEVLAVPGRLHSGDLVVEADLLCCSHDGFTIQDVSRRSLGWRPRPAETTIVETAESLRDVGLLERHQ